MWIFYLEKNVVKNNKSEQKSFGSTSDLINSGKKILFLRI